MDAVQYILNNLDLAKVLAHYDFDKVKSMKGMYRACCKIHGGNNPTAFVINPENGLWYCHTGGCGGGSIFELVQKLEECHFLEAVKELASILHLDIENMEVIEHLPSHQEEVKRWLKTMRKIQHKKTANHFTIPEPIKKVTKYRTFKPETLEHFRIGYLESATFKNRDNKEFTLKNRIVFPVVFDGVQVAMSLRKIKASDSPKWSHHPTGFVSGDYLYNYDEAKDKSVIAIVEGFLDVWAYHEIGIPAVATFGAHITEEQYKLLLRTGADLVFSFDGDEAGRLATQKAIEMFRYKANIATVDFDTHEDPESIPREELMKRYANRRKYF